MTKICLEKADDASKQKIPQQISESTMKYTQDKSNMNSTETRHHQLIQKTNTPNKEHKSNG